MGLVETKRAVIFDLDGVISDTQTVHAEVESEFLKGVGIHIDACEITARFAGVGDQEMFKTIFAERGLSHPIEQISEQEWGMMMARINKEGIKPMPYALELIQTLSKNDFILAIASGSPRFFIDRVLQCLNIESFFASSVSAQEVAHGKPAPDVFIEAAKKAHMDINRCIIIEDGMSGMEAAARANIPCIGLVEDKSKTYPTTLLVQSLQEITIDKIRRWQDDACASLPAM